MRANRSTLATLALGSLVLTAACSAEFGPPQASGPGGSFALERFDSCDDLLEYFKSEAAERVTAWGLYPERAYLDFDGAVQDEAADSAPAAGDGGATSHSETNNQVEGVDEADVVKTDGEVIVTSVSGKVRVIDADAQEVIATIEVPGIEDGSAELLLNGEELVVLSTAWHGGGSRDTHYERTSITRVDLSDPSNPVVVGTTRVEGTYRSARMIDGTVRLVMVSQPTGLEFTTPRNSSMSAEAEALETNRQVIADSTIGDWLPHRQSVSTAGVGGAPEFLLECDAIGRPAEVSGFATVSVVTLSDDGDATPSSAAGVLGSGDTVYASTDRVIVATSPWESWAVEDASEASQSQTDLHTFDITDPEATTYTASGRVDGWLLNQFAIDETGGMIRVATTLNPPSGSEPSSSSLVVLSERGDRLVETGRVDGLGETERIYSVRYLGPELAAVVTFRETDPLYLIDTSDPSDPQELGELKIPGYSAYLHPVGEGRLLGIGQDATDDGRTTGLQASLFDISDPNDPQRISLVTWPDTSSPAEWDHRAFLQWQDRVYLPAETYSWDHDSGDEESFTGLITVDVTSQEVTEGPRIDTKGDGFRSGSVVRSLVIGDDLWAIGHSEVFTFDLETLRGGQVATI